MTAAYCLVIDEPIGVAVGFDPQNEINEMCWENWDKCEVVEDDGGDLVFLSNKGNDVAIRSSHFSNDSFFECDLLVWRTPDELLQWWRDYNS